METLDKEKEVLGALLKHAWGYDDGTQAEIFKKINLDGVFQNKTNKKISDLLKNGHNSIPEITNSFPENKKVEVTNYLLESTDKKGAYKMQPNALQGLINKTIKTRLEAKITKLINSGLKTGNYDHEKIGVLYQKINRMEIEFESKKARILSFSEINEKPIEWIIDGMLARGMLHALGAVQGHGKTLFLIDLAARASRGKSWPITGESIPQGETLFITDEDSRDRIIKPRIKAAGGVESKIFIPDFDVEKLDLPQDINKLEGWIERLTNPLFLFLDPIVDYANGSLNASEEATKIIQPLRSLADRKNICILYTVHFNKKVDLDSIHRIAHSYVLTSKPRLVWMIAKQDPDDDLNTDRLLLCGKTAFKPIKNMIFSIKGNKEDVPYINDWHTTKIQTTSAMASGERRRDLKVQEAEDFLNSLKGQTLYADDVRTMGEKKGIAKTTLYRARNGPNCNIEDDHDEKGKKFWIFK